MDERKLIVDSSPHTFANRYKYKLMWAVFAALMPAAIASVYFFGVQALLIMLISVASAIITDAIFERLRKKPISVQNGASAVTGLLLAMVIPPTVPLWVAALGSFVAIAIAKHAFGGAGNTIFNPALVGRAFLVAAFPGIMIRYAWPSNWPDAVTSASPLTMLQLSGYEQTISYMGGKIAAYKALLIGNVSGSLGETSALLLLIGGLFLIATKVINWKVPTIYIGTVFALCFVFGQDPIFHILSGGLFIGAFFMATAYEGMPITPTGRIYFAIGLGVLTVLIRVFGGYPEGVNYSILLMNAASPLIERLTIRKPFGYKQKK